MIIKLVLFSLMVFAVIFSLKRGKLIEKVASISFLAITMLMTYSDHVITKYGIAIIPIITGALFIDTVRDRSIMGLKRFALISMYIGSSLVNLFKFQHWAGASTLALLSIIATVSSVIWIAKSRPVNDRQFGVMLFLTVDLILIQFGIF